MQNKHNLLKTTFSLIPLFVDKCQKLDNFAYASVTEVTLAFIKQDYLISKR